MVFDLSFYVSGDAVVEWGEWHESFVEAGFLNHDLHQASGAFHQPEFF